MWWNGIHEDGRSRPSGHVSQTIIRPCRRRGAALGTALIVEYYDELPDPQNEDPKEWEERLRMGLEQFKEQVEKRYSEGTLLRLLRSDDARSRRASILALGLLGEYKNCNSPIAAMLRDEDRGVRQFAADALWSLWFRADTEENCQELRRVIEIRDRRRKRAGLDALIAKAPHYAEAYNQRAILHFMIREFHKSIVDCERVLKLNPHHFGAAAGLGRCHMELRKNRAALKAYRQALKINPGMEDVEEAIRQIESALGEEGRRDEKK
jgi:tetratricopeptide (TPR) repeat protein